LTYDEGADQAEPSPEYNIKISDDEEQKESCTISESSFSGMEVDSEAIKAVKQPLSSECFRQRLQEKLRNLNLSSSVSNFSNNLDHYQAIIGKPAFVQGRAH
jgi:hypothetical protein